MPEMFIRDSGPIPTDPPLLKDTRLIREIELSHASMKFSSGHFSIFSQTEREFCHGHNFRVAAAFTARDLNNGMTVDYRVLKNMIVAICRKLNGKFLLPMKSQFMKLEHVDSSVHLRVNGDLFVFPATDVVPLNIENATVEELSRYILGEVLASEVVKGHGIEKIKIKVSTGPGIWGSSTWEI